MVLVGSKATRTSAYPLSHPFPSPVVYNSLEPLAYARDVQRVCDELDMEAAEEYGKRSMPKPSSKTHPRARMVLAYDRRDLETFKQLHASLTWKENVERASRARKRQHNKAMRRER